MRVDIQRISFEETGKVVESNAHESLTFIANESVVHKEPNSSDENRSYTRVYLQFKIVSTNSDSTSETIITFWGMEIKKLVYFACTGGKMKLILRPVDYQGVITVDFLNSADAQQFWHYVSDKRLRRSVSELLFCL